MAASLTVVRPIARFGLFFFFCCLCEDKSILSLLLQGTCRNYYRQLLRENRWARDLIARVLVNEEAVIKTDTHCASSCAVRWSLIRWPHLTEHSSLIDALAWTSNSIICTAFNYYDISSGEHQLCWERSVRHGLTQASALAAGSLKRPVIGSTLCSSVYFPDGCQCWGFIRGHLNVLSQVLSVWCHLFSVQDCSHYSDGKS